jgi:hypothetical protein
VILAPLREAPGRDEIGATGVVVIDLRSEKLEHALGRFSGRREQPVGSQRCSGVRMISLLAIRLKPMHSFHFHPA